MLSEFGPYIEKYNTKVCIAAAAVMAIYEYFNIKNNGITRYSVAECVIYVVLFAISVQGGLNFFNFVFIFLIIGRNLDFKKTADYQAITIVCVLLFIILSAKMHFIPNIISTWIREREALGFNQVNHAACFLIGAFMLRAYAAGKDMKATELFLWMVSSFWIYQKTDSRVSWYATLFLCLLLVLQKDFPEFLPKRKYLSVAICMTFVIIAAVSILLMLKYSPDIPAMAKLDNLLTFRIRLSYEAFNKFGVTALGRRILSSHSEDPIWVDNFYARILIQYGCIMFTAILALFTSAMIVAREKHDSYMLIMLVITAIVSFGETTLLFMAYNSFWFAIPMIFRALEENDRTKLAANVPPGSEAPVPASDIDQTATDSGIS